MLDILKMLLGIKDNEQDSLLSFLLDEAKNFILGQCNLDFVPSQLEGLVPEIAADMYRYKCYGTEKAPQTVKSIAQDKRTVTFSDSGEDGYNYLDKYVKLLRPFMRRRGRLPSDIV